MMAATCSEQRVMALILVVDDEPYVREFLRESLSESGHQVIEAQNGKAGLRLFRQHRPELVITDLFMPEQEGIQTIRQLRAEAAEDVRIIAISGGGTYGFVEALDGLQALGADRTLQKPFRERELLSVVSQTLA